MLPLNKLHEISQQEYLQSLGINTYNNGLYNPNMNTDVNTHNTPTVVDALSPLNTYHDPTQGNDSQTGSVYQDPSAINTGAIVLDTNNNVNTSNTTTTTDETNTNTNTNTNENNNNANTNSTTTTNFMIKRKTNKEVHTSKDNDKDIITLKEKKEDVKQNDTLLEMPLNNDDIKLINELNNDKKDKEKVEEQIISVLKKYNKNILEYITLVFSKKILKFSNFVKI
jgi:hypothetical protein